MSQSDIVTPIATSVTSQCVITPRWFVQDTEFPPAQASYLPLVNGEEAFAAVHQAIASARTSVDIICWGFQPSMYFIRDGQAPCIGQLLCDIARERKVKVRVLGWEMPLNAAGRGGEANLPGKGAIRIKDRAGQTSTDGQYDFDRWWFTEHSYDGKWKNLMDGSSGVFGDLIQLYMHYKKCKTPVPLFVSRGFGAGDREKIGQELRQHRTDKALSAGAITTMQATVTHHQKTVLVDYELPEHAVGFVMGHNMLDEYWDTDKHTAKNRGSDKPAPNAGPRGNLPRQDISCRVTGPVLKHLHENFATAWRREVGEDLRVSRNAGEVAKKLRPRPEQGTPLMAQLLRTQVQENRRDIETLYLQAVNNATQFIYIENQYFRWPPLAEAIKKMAAAQTCAGRDPGRHGPLHLFVVTNVTDEGIGKGTVNTQRMLESLGRASAIPGVTKLMRRTKVFEEAFSGQMPVFTNKSEADAYSQAMNQKLAEVRRKTKAIDDEVILPEKRPGLKVHICSLVAADSPPEKWMPVYIHSKLMIIDDVFTTHGSANINTRSMQVDSEINIAHDWASVTKALRRRLWDLHTCGRGVQDNAVKAFKAWEDLLARNQTLQNTRKSCPEAPLIPFNYDKPKMSDLD